MAPQHLDHRGRPLVAVTGMGVVTCLGRGKEENWRKLISGQSGISAISRFPTEGMRTTIAGTVESIRGTPYSAYELASEIAEDAIAEALGEARILAGEAFGGPLFVATPPSEFEWPLLAELFRYGSQIDMGPAYSRMLAAARSGHFREAARHLEFASIATRLQEHFETSGEPISLCTACASGSTAIQMGLEAIRRGEADRAICVATDATVHPEGLARFSLLSALSTRNDPPQKASRPFSRDRDGFVVAEGAGALVLERLSTALERGAGVIAIVRGCGEKADDYHRTRSKPDGTAIIGAITGALTDAGLDAVDYVNAHGTSTLENDKMEYLSLRAVLGNRLDRIPVSANKSMIGHTLIAAGAVEAVFSVLALARGIIPPTLNYDEPDPELTLDVVPHVAREASIKTVLSNSFGFGGQNCCVAFSSLDHLSS